MKYVLEEMMPAFWAARPRDQQFADHCQRRRDGEKLITNVIATMLKADEPKMVIRVVDFKDELRSW